MKKTALIVILCIIMFSLTACKDRAGVNNRDFGGTESYSDTSESTSEEETTGDSALDEVLENEGYLFEKYGVEDKEVTVPEQLGAYSFIYKSSDSVSEEGAAVSFDGENILIYQNDNGEVSFSAFIAAEDGYDVYGAKDAGSIRIDEAGRLTGLYDTEYTKEGHLTSEEFSGTYKGADSFYSFVCLYLKNIDTKAVLSVVDRAEGYTVSQSEDGQCRVLDGDREAGYFIRNHEYGYIEEFVFEKNCLVMSFTPDYFGSVSDILT